MIYWLISAILREKTSLCGLHLSGGIGGITVRKNLPFAVIVVVGLVVLSGLYLGLGHLRHEREAELARLTGSDELTQQLQIEADEYRITNRNQQIGVVVIGSAIVLVSVAFWLRQSKGDLPAQNDTQ